MRGAFGEDSRKTAELGQEGWGLRRVRRENIDRGTEWGKLLGLSTRMKNEKHEIQLYWRKKVVGISSWIASNFIVLFSFFFLANEVEDTMQTESLCFFIYFVTLYRMGNWNIYMFKFVFLISHCLETGWCLHYFYNDPICLSLLLALMVPILFLTIVRASRPWLL